MTIQDIIDKWEKELLYSQHKSDEFRINEKLEDADKWQQNVLIIRVILDDFKKLNEEAVSEEEKCTFKMCKNNNNGKKTYGCIKCKGHFDLADF